METGKTSPNDSVGRAGRYFKYAIGEIILVVIGILIAIQINTFYKKQAEKVTNIQLLNRMISEIELNIERLDYLEYNFNLDSLNNQPFSKNEKSLERSLAILEQGVSSSNIDSLVNLDFNRSSYNLHRSIYDEMINTGKLYNIASEALISEINEYYKRIEKEDYYNNHNITNVNELYFDCKYGWINFKKEYQLNPKLNVQDYEWFNDRTSKEFINLRTYFSTAYNVIQRSRGRVDGIRNASKQLIEHIQIKIND